MKTRLPKSPPSVELPRGFWAKLALTTSSTALVMVMLIVAVIMGLSESTDVPVRSAAGGAENPQVAAFMDQLLADAPVRPRVRLEANPLPVEVLEWTGADRPRSPGELVGKPLVRNDVVATILNEEVIVAGLPELPPTREPAAAQTPAQPASDVVEPPVPAVNQPVAAAVPPALPKPGLARLVETEVSRRLGLNEQELLAQLEQVPEVKLESAANVREALTTASPGARSPQESLESQLALSSLGSLVSEMARDSRRQGLPVETTNNMLGPLDAASLKLLSKQIREAGLPDDASARGVARVRATAPADAASLKRMFEGPWRAQQIDQRLNVVPTLVQMLQVEDESTRMEMVRELNRVKGRQASTALAFRALFDGSAEVRSLSIEALRRRPREEYRGWLLRALRYPWAPVADRAAKTLIELRDSQSVPYLVKLLQEQDPAQPVFDQKQKQYYQRELVRINHLGSCCLCHAPSLQTTDTVRGLVPTPGKPLPVQYYEGMPGAFVRADITFLRQDFSLMHRVSDASPWPSEQRFDYLVRTRPLAPAEVKERGLDPDNKARTEGAELYPQQQAVYFALSKLSGQDLGLEPQAWQEYLKEKQRPRLVVATAAR
ncbi:MAG: HEAT repeat domain-containing protein [Gemmataceae bacterium]